MTTITVKLKPGAKKDSINIKDDGSLTISVTSRPVEGKANDHLIKLLSKALHIPKSSCRIIQGSKARDKVVVVEGVKRGEIIKQLRRITAR